MLHPIWWMKRPGSKGFDKLLGFELWPRWLQSQSTLTPFPPTVAWRYGSVPLGKHRAWRFCCPELPNIDVPREQRPARNKGEGLPSTVASLQGRGRLPGLAHSYFYDQPEPQFSLLWIYFWGFFWGLNKRVQANFLAQWPLAQWCPRKLFWLAVTWVEAGWGGDGDEMAQKTTGNFITETDSMCKGRNKTRRKNFKNLAE